MCGLRSLWSFLSGAAAALRLNTDKSRQLEHAFQDGLKDLVISYAAPNKGRLRAL